MGGCCVINAFINGLWKTAFLLFNTILLYILAIY